MGAVTWFDGGYRPDTVTVDLLATLDTLVPAVYAGATLTGLPADVRTACRAALTAPHHLTLVHGPTGEGKTRAMWATRRHAASIGDRRTWMIETGADLLGSRGSLDPALWHRAKTVDVLVVDDILRGLNTWGDREATRMTELLTSRYGKPTLATDNRDPLEIDRTPFSADFTPLFRRLMQANIAELPRTKH